MINRARKGKDMKIQFRLPGVSNRYQSGVVTTFTGVLVLVLLTLMMFFAIRVGVFEQRVSSNEMRQKLAFHAAESGIHHAKEYLRKNVALIASETNDLLPDGTDGWLSADGMRWRPCSEAPDSDLIDVDLAVPHKGSHPCYAETGVYDDDSLRRDTMFYYTNDPEAASETESTLYFPVDTAGLALPGTTEDVEVFALLCVLEVDEAAPPTEAPVKGCVTDLTDPDPDDSIVRDGTYFMVTFMARGQADCNGGTCNAEALISEQVSNFGAASGGNSPAVPLTTKSSFPPSGTAEVVPNPNSGGVGVPISVWMNGNTSCSVDDTVIDPSSGSWSTCEMHEWYGVDVLPEDYTCSGTCTCTQDESISYTHGVADTLGIDLVQDEEFPCDLFQFYFAVPRANYEIVKAWSQIIDNCDSLGPNSFGIYWVTGSECRINANTQVGSPGAPILLISAASVTRLNGGSNIYGTLFISDVEDANATLESNGTNTVYGSVIVDGILGSYLGTFQVVWNENTARKAGKGGGIGTVIGGWSDFHRDWRWDGS
jgi:hypothetical protein